VDFFGIQCKYVAMSRTIALRM